MTNDPWTVRLSEYLDGELPAAERGQLERHLEACAECRETLADLRRVVARAGALDARPPHADLWAGIADRIGTTPPRVVPLRRRIAFTVPQLAAAGLALLLSGAGIAWLTGTRGGGSTPPAAVPTVASGAPATPRMAARFADASYDQAVADLERVLREHRGALDTTTVRVLEQSLASIDDALGRARAALAADPNNTYLNAHLAETMRRKLDLLRRAAALATASL